MNEGATRTKAKVAVDLPREVVRLLSIFGFIRRVRDGHDKTKASVDVFDAVGRGELVSPDVVRIEITPRGMRRLLEWFDELRDKIGSEIADARRTTVEEIKKLDDAKS